MLRIIAFLIVAMAVASATKNPKNKIGKVSKGCHGAMMQCSQKLTGLRQCRSVWNSLVLQMIRGDANNDCVVDGDDVEEMAEVYLDTNDDGKICHKEWADFMVSYFSFTGQAADSWFQLYKEHMTSGCVDIEDMDEVEDLSLKSKFLNGQIEQLVKFCSGSPHLFTNRDCWGLVSVCKEIVPSLPACKKLDLSKSKTLYEKLKLEQQTVDADGNGFITKQETNNDLLKHFDLDRNGCISQNEWVNRYTSFYGFSAEFARAFYATIQDINKDRCISIGDFPASGVPADPRPAYLMDTLITMCQAYPHMFADNQDCVSVVDTCSTHFRHLGKCTPFLKSQCGLEAYSSCVSGLTRGGGACTAEADKFQVKFEILKINNQINTTCTENDINSATPRSASLVLLMTLVGVLLSPL